MAVAAFAENAGKARLAPPAFEGVRGYELGRGFPIPSGRNIVR